MEANEERSATSHLVDSNPRSNQIKVKNSTKRSVIIGRESNCCLTLSEKLTLWQSPHMQNFPTEIYPYIKKLMY